MTSPHLLDKSSFLIIVLLYCVKVVVAVVVFLILLRCLSEVGFPAFHHTADLSFIHAYAACWNYLVVEHDELFILLLRHGLLASLSLSLSFGLLRLRRGFVRSLLTSYSLFLVRTLPFGPTL